MLYMETVFSCELGLKHKVIGISVQGEQGLPGSPGPDGPPGPMVSRSDSWPVNCRISYDV